MTNKKSRTYEEFRAYIGLSPRNRKERRIAEKKKNADEQPHTTKKDKNDE